MKAQVFWAVSARSQAMGNIGTMLAGTWSTFHNQAGLAVVDRTSFSFHFEDRFLVAGWETEAFSCCLPVKSGTIGIGCIFFGNGTYNEIKTGLVFGKSLGGQIRVGIEMDYLRIQQPSGYGNLHALVPGAGIQVLPVKNLVIALHVFNPAGQHFVNCKSMLIPVTIRTGASLALGEEVLICAELMKDLGKRATYGMGLEYTMGENLQVRVGAHFGEFAQPSFGLGFAAGIFKIDLSVKHHPIAAYSFAASLSLSN